MNEVIIEDVSSEGDGIGRLESGQVVFVKGTLPGDKVRLELLGKKKKLQIAKVSQWLEESPDRVLSRCHDKLCGGCVLKDYSYLGQARTKLKRLHEALRRIAGVDWEQNISLVQVGDGWNYRHRVRLHADRRGRLGFYQRNSRKLAPFKGCPVLWPELETVLRKLVSETHRLPGELGLREVELSYSRISGRAAAFFSFEGNSNVWVPTMEWLEKIGIAGLWWSGEDTERQVGNVELLYDHQRSNEYKLFYSPGMFTQANPAVNDRLIDHVLEIFDALNPQRTMGILELHSGVGNLSIPLAKAQHLIRVTEANPKAVNYCRRNAQDNGLSLSIEALNDVDAMKWMAESDILLADPPRFGMRDVCEWIVKHKYRPTIVYVSCDPGTLARDIRILSEVGYKPCKVNAFDMFPETPHIESVVVLAVDAGESF
ncbi:MAG: TRAM domain-containing protein [Myxococcota bacterium]|nr:TRAM domain-containing protein [Myxococcota bacterium]